MVRYLFYTIGDLTYQSPLVVTFEFVGHYNINLQRKMSASQSQRDFFHNLHKYATLSPDGKTRNQTDHIGVHGRL